MRPNFSRLSREWGRAWRRYELAGVGRCFLLAGLLLLGLLQISGCEGNRTEQLPAVVRWDRDVGEYCGMVISDQRFAAQAVAPNGRAHKFDDLGCLVNWLEDQSWRAEAKIWVREQSGERWIDARAAHYRERSHSPMGYGFLASDAPAFGPLDFAAVRQASLASRQPGRKGEHPTGSTPAVQENHGGTTMKPGAGMAKGRPMPPHSQGESR